MNDDNRKRLTEFCPSLDLIYSADYHSEETAQKLVFFALVERLRETGKWRKFILFADRKWANDPASVLWWGDLYEPQIVPFSDWLLDHARFEGLVAEFLVAHP